LEMGFVACGTDRCIYKKKDDGGRVYICLYVDDMIVAAKLTETVRRVKKAIARRFQIKDLGTVKHLLGMEIDYDHSKRVMHITQQYYIKATAEMFKQVSARATENPCDQSVKLSSKDCPQSDMEKETMSRTPFRQLIGRLLYVATCTRPDVAFAVSQLSSFASNPGPTHWKAAIKVLRYLHTTSEVGLHYQGDSNVNQLTAQQCGRPTFSVGYPAYAQRWTSGVQVQVPTHCGVEHVGG
jgi:hypothetical protein